MKESRHPLRVFVSYSHEDRGLAKAAAEVISGLGLVPVWDRDIRPGTPFTEAIKEMIGQAHVFMPLITESSSKRPWVHQETGYAMALRIPVVPVAIGTVPGEMAAELQALLVRSDMADFGDRLGRMDLESLVLAPRATTQLPLEVTAWAEERTGLLAENARRLADLGTLGRIRQRAALSSFSIPDRPPGDPVWEEREGERPLSPYHRDLQRKERRALERHARQAGCDLIIDPEFSIERHGDVAGRARVRILAEFLGSMSDDSIRVVLSPRAREGNVTLIGDWFSAVSMSRDPAQAHRQTVMSWHAPSVLQQLQDFDEEMSQLLRGSDVEPGATRTRALTAIAGLLA
jgi:hypothetical protein